LAVSLLIANGCGSKQIRTLGGGVTPSNGQISKQDLRDRLDKFAEYFKAKFRQMSTNLNERVPSKRTEKTTLQMRARMTEALNTMLDQDDPIIAFIETWALCTRLRMYLEEGEGSTLYGEGQEIALNDAKLLETEIERTGRIFLKDDVLQAAKKNIVEFANANPIKGTFSGITVFATEAKKDQPNPFMSIAKIPMTPFRAIEGVDRTASAVHRFTDSTERLSDIVSELPESSRWQLQLLLYDLEETDMTKSFLASLAQFSESSQRLSKSVDELPQQLRQETSRFVQEVDSKQANLQKTLEQTEKTTVAITGALEKLQTASVSVDTAAKDAAETAKAWQSAAQVIGDVASEYYKKSDSSDPNRSFDIKEWTTAAEKTSQAAIDIGGLLSAVDDLSKNHNYSNIMNAITLRAVGFVGLVFVLAIMYRIVSVRLVRAPNPNMSTKPITKAGRKRRG
jgi:methyl-accepting chemotaxis protein